MAGLSYPFAGKNHRDENTGYPPCGASAIAGGRQGTHRPSENGLAGARHKDRYIISATTKLMGLTGKIHGVPANRGRNGNMLRKMTSRRIPGIERIGFTRRRRQGGKCLTGIQYSL
jgi:hypothetical protein